MALHPITGIGLCAGVGWLDLGVKLAFEYLGFDYRTVCFCERDSFAASVLMARMEDTSLEPAAICDSLEDVGTQFQGVDVVTAGFPCQPWSVAGSRKGIDDDRWIWPDISRVIRRVEPRFVMLENVPGLLAGDGAGIGSVLDSLAELGFDAEWTTLSAAAVGASHKRERWFCVAYRNVTRPILERSSRLLDGKREAFRNDADGCDTEVADSTRTARRERSGPDGGSEVVGTGKNVGDTISPREDARSEASGSRNSTGESSGQLDDSERGRASQLERRGRSAVASDVANSIGTGLERQPAIGSERTNDGFSGRDGRTSIFAPGPGDVDAWGRVVADGSFDFRAPSIKPGVRVLVDGVTLVVDQSRADQLRCAGNGVVVAQACCAYIKLMQRIGVKKLLEVSRNLQKSARDS